MPEEFTVKNIVESLEIPRERFNEWVFRGYIKATVKKADGLGTKNIYNRVDIYGVALFKHLIENVRLPREDASRFIDKWVKSAQRRPAKVAGLYNYLVFLQDEKRKIYLKQLSILTGSGHEDIEYKLLSQEMVELLKAHSNFDVISVIDIRKIIKKVDLRLQN
jgi:hypothetical protein